MDRQLKHEDGFSLIELMIAVAVLALLSTLVTLSVTRPGSNDEAEWQQFSRVFESLRSKAVLTRQTLGLTLNSDGYQSMTFSEGWQETGAPTAWQSAVTVQLPGNPFSPVVTIGSHGQTGALRVRFQERTCFTSGWEPLECARN